MLKTLYFVVALTMNGGKIEIEQFPIASAEACQSVAGAVAALKSDEDALIFCAAFPVDTVKEDPA